MSEGNTVTASVQVALDPGTAFKVFTDEIDAWYVRGPYSFYDDERAVAIRIEPHVGGRLWEVWDEATGEGHEWGRVLHWEPGVRLVFADLIHQQAPEPPTEVEVRFDANDGGTLVTLEHRGLDSLPPERAATIREHGWALVLRWFAESLAQRQGAS